MLVESDEGRASEQQLTHVHKVNSPPMKQKHESHRILHGLLTKHEVIIVSVYTELNAC